MSRFRQYKPAWPTGPLQPGQDVGDYEELRSKSRSPYGHGVSAETRSRKIFFKSRLTIDKVTGYLGKFHTAHAARLAYDQAALQICPNRKPNYPPGYFKLNNPKIQKKIDRFRHRLQHGAYPPGDTSDNDEEFMDDADDGTCHFWSQTAEPAAAAAVVNSAAAVKTAGPTVPETVSLAPAWPNGRAAATTGTRSAVAAAAASSPDSSSTHASAPSASIGAAAKVPAGFNGHFDHSGPSVEALWPSEAALEWYLTNVHQQQQQHQSDSSSDHPIAVDHVEVGVAEGAAAAAAAAGTANGYLPHQQRTAAVAAAVEGHQLHPDALGPDLLQSGQMAAAAAAARELRSHAIQTCQPEIKRRSSSSDDHGSTSAVEGVTKIRRLADAPSPAAAAAAAAAVLKPGFAPGSDALDCLAAAAVALSAAATQAQQQQQQWCCDREEDDVSCFQGHYEAAAAAAEAAVPSLQGSSGGHQDSVDHVAATAAFTTVSNTRLEGRDSLLSVQTQHPSHHQQQQQQQQQPPARGWDMTADHHHHQPQPQQQQYDCLQQHHTPQQQQVQQTQLDWFPRRHHHQQQQHWQQQQQHPTVRQQLSQFINDLSSQGLADHLLQQLSFPDVVKLLQVLLDDDRLSPIFKQLQEQTPVA